MSKQFKYKVGDRVAVIEVDTYAYPRWDTLYRCWLVLVEQCLNEYGYPSVAYIKGESTEKPSGGLMILECVEAETTRDYPRWEIVNE